MTVATWLTPDQVATHGGQSTSAGGDPALQMWAEAARDWVENVGRRDLDYSVPANVPPRVVAGAAMLAWRWYQRRGSSAGVVGFSDLGASQVLSSDPDIAQLLGIGRRRRFVFGAGRKPTGDELAQLTTPFP